MFLGELLKGTKCDSIVARESVTKLGRNVLP